MNDGVQLGAGSGNKRKRDWPGRLAMTLGPPLALFIYLFLLDQYGFALFEQDGDDDVADVAPVSER